MSDGTPIEWTDATLNVVNGCSVVSPGCTNCYAMRSGARGLPNHPATGLTKASRAGHVWTGEVRFNDKALLLPLRWKRPRKIFWNAHGDLFHEKVPDEWIDRCFAVMALTPHHIHQVLTKRPERMREYMTGPVRTDPRSRECEVYEQWRLMREQWREAMPWHREWDWSLRSAQGLGSCTPSWPLPNVWLGTSVEDQQRADERIPHLLATPAAVRWLSCEPLLGPVELDSWLAIHKHWLSADSLPAAPWHPPYPKHWYKPQALVLAGYERPIRWVVAGGESGPGARPMHPDWARSLRDQCAAAGVPFLFKQWGEFAPGEIAGEFLDSEKAAKGLSLFDGCWDDCWSEPEGHCDDEPDVYRIGKKRAGRRIDGVQHDGFPA